MQFWSLRCLPPERGNLQLFLHELAQVPNHSEDKFTKNPMDFYQAW